MTNALFNDIDIIIVYSRPIIVLCILNMSQW